MIISRLRNEIWQEKKELAIEILFGVDSLIRESGYENMGSNQSGVFQVDATMATAGVFAEMLLQSQDGMINLLPALPAEWPEGEIKGVVARGGFLVDIAWENGALRKAVVYVPKGGNTPVVRITNKDADQRVEFIKM